MLGWCLILAQHSGVWPHRPLRLVLLFRHRIWSSVESSRISGTVNDLWSWSSTRIFRKFLRCLMKLSGICNLAWKGHGVGHVLGNNALPAWLEERWAHGSFPYLRKESSFCYSGHETPTSATSLGHPPLNGHPNIFLFFKSFKKVVFLIGQAFPPPTLMARPLVEELFSAAFLTNLLLRL